MKKSMGAKTLVYPTPVFIVGTYDREWRANVMTAAWGGICCSRPPCVAVSLRQATYTYGSIMEQEAFTINIPSQDYVKEADFFGIVSGKDRDKFAASGLTPVKSDLVNAPYIKEFPIVLECRLLHVLEIGLHTQFVGEILDVKADKAVIGDDGLIDIEKVKPIAFDLEGKAYHGIGEFVGKAWSIGREVNSHPF
ncbi:MAG: flavin reductase family protein [Deltaproteobacteria bacterium]|nr:MAG: flavin reductase family protein [Deltaproteobacteria bacterium]